MSVAPTNEQLRNPSAREVLASRLVANLATLNRDGTILLVPMWFFWDGEAVLMSTGPRTQKARNLERDPRCSVTIHDSRGGVWHRGVRIVGRAELIGPPRSLELIRAIRLKYVTEAGLALPAAQAFLGGDATTIRVVPERVAVWDTSGMEAARALLESGEFERLTPVFG